MDKKNAITNINKFGKIGRIVTIIMLILLGISLVATLISAIFLKVVPDDLLALKMSTQSELSVNFKAVDPGFAQSEMQKIVEGINSSMVKGGLNLGSVKMAFNKASIVDDHLVLSTNAEVGTVSLPKIGTALIFVIISIIISIISTVFGMKLCKAIENCVTPFEANVINKLKYFAYSLIPWALYSSIPESVMNSLFSNNVSISFTLDMNIVFTVLIILALSVIFKYGAMLQQESDETL